MNWDRGLKRITLALSIIGAIIGAGLFFYDEWQMLSSWKSYLAKDRREVFSEEHERSLIRFWNVDLQRANKNAPLLQLQQEMWKDWTGLELGKEPWWEEIARPVDESEEEQKVRLRKKIEELERLKERGWQTANGDRLTLTPEDIWQMQRPGRIKGWEDMVWQSRNEVPIATATGAFLGFCAVWAAYAAVKWAGLPVYGWFSLGFREDKQKDDEETNGSDKPGGNCQNDEAAQ